LRSRRRFAGFREPVAVGDLQIPSIRIPDVEALDSLAVVLATGAQSPLPQFRLDRPGVPRFDHETEVLHRCSTVARRLPEDRRAPIANLQHRLRTVVAAQFPAHERYVKGGFYGFE